jgi:hypothetical protein
MEKILATAAEATERAFFKVRLFMAVAFNLAVHGAGDVLFLTEDEAKAHAHKLEPMTADQVAALGLSQHTAANIVAAVQGLPSDAVVKGLASGAIHEDTARAAFPDAFLTPSIQDMSATLAAEAAVERSPTAAEAAASGASPSEESATGAAVEAAAEPSPAPAEAAAPAAPDSTNKAPTDEQASA